MPIPNGTTSVAELKDSLDVLTFDLYGTVVDMQIHRIMHVANHAFDCIGAQAQGMRGAYINRRGRPYEDTPYQPDLVVNNFLDRTFRQNVVLINGEPVSKVLPMKSGIGVLRSLSEMVADSAE